MYQLKNFIDSLYLSSLFNSNKYTAKLAFNFSLSVFIF